MYTMFNSAVLLLLYLASGSGGGALGTFTLANECSPCSSSSDCSTRKCWGFTSFDRKCVFDNNQVSINRCFPGSAGGGFGNNGGLGGGGGSNFPFIGGGFGLGNSANECSACSSSSDCSTGKCWGFTSFDKRCVFDNNQDSMNRCFPGSAGRGFGNSGGLASAGGSSFPFIGGSPNIPFTGSGFHFPFFGRSHIGRGRHGRHGGGSFFKRK